MFSKLSAGKNPPEQVNAVIEIPQGSNTKYEVDEESGVIFVDRFSFTAFQFPFNYGFIPQTAGKDGDPLDIIVLSSYPIHPGCAIKVTPIGMLEMEDEEGIDHKIIAVPIAKVDPVFGNYQSLEELPQNYKDKIKHFYEHYKDLEPGKWIKVQDWKDKTSAHKEIKSALR